MLTHRAGVVGSPVEHSLSPVLHRAAYDALGLTGWSYDRFRIGGEGELDLPTFVEGLGRDWVGLSVTMPDKEAALALATTATDQARRIGAANTLVRHEDGWAAANTDPHGVRDALLEAGVGDVRRALVLGAGATARSALDALAGLGCRDVGFAVRGRVRPETLDLAERLGVRAPRREGGHEGGHEGVRESDVLLGDPLAVSRACAEADVVVSTLPAGAPLGEEAGFDPRADLSRTVLLDAVYADWPTPLARWAEACGATVVPGSEMLLHQAAGQVELMTGHAAPLEAMRRALDDALRAREHCS